jgi:sugar phosphate isomerase/epimerase
MINRRRFLETTGLAAAAWSLGARSALAALPAEARVGMCDWNLGPMCDPEQIPKARAAGLDGIQVSVATRPDHVPLRDAAVRNRYLELGRQHGVSFPSVAAGSILNRIPLMSEPQSAVYVIDAVEAAAALGGTNILMAFFGNGDLRLRDAMDEFRNVSTGPFSSYALDERGVTRVVEALRQIAPRAEDAGIALGLENTLTAVQNLEVIDRVGSPMVQVYYDVGNATAYGYDVPTELRLLGNDRICEIHCKETLTLEDPMKPVLGGPPEGGVDFDAVAAACRDIGYDKWFILETSGREDRFTEDTQANAGFLRARFGS